MRTKQLIVTVYDVGDMLNVKDGLVCCNRSKTGLYSAERILIVGVNELANNKVSYKVITNNGLAFTLKQEELGQVLYIGHIDLNGFFNGGCANEQKTSER